MTDPLVLGLLERHLLIHISKRLRAPLQLLIPLPNVALALGVIRRRFWPVLFILHRDTRGERACQMSAVHPTALPCCCCKPLHSSSTRAMRNGQRWPQSCFLTLLGN